jgi:hypothetical protein
MKSGGPWNLRGLLPEVREAARTAARQSGLTVGEWLNRVIEAVDEQEGESAPSAGLDRFSDDGSRQSLRSDDRWRDTDWDDSETNAQRCQHFRAEDPQQDRRYHDADWDDREANAQRRQNFPTKERERESRYHDRDWNEREAHPQRRQQFHAEDPQQERRYHDADWDDREATPQRRQSFRAKERENDRPYLDAHWRDHASLEEAAHRYYRQGGPCREDRRRYRPDKSPSGKATARGDT